MEDKHYKFYCQTCGARWQDVDYSDTIPEEADFYNGMTCPHCNSEEITGKEINYAI